MKFHWLVVLFSIVFILSSASQDEYQRNHYILYDVNYGEGFNLRRDVYVRFANLVRFLHSRQPTAKWTLVLPPWGRLYHWFNNRNLEQVPWATFFDVPSLNLFVPVVEFHQFLADTAGAPIDRVYYLQAIPFDGKWKERVELRPCESSSHSYRYSKSRGLWFGWMYGYMDQPIREFACLSAQAEAKTLVDFVLKQAQQVRSVMFDRGETVTHGTYSEWSPEWWTARRSMVFSKRLRQLASEFRRDQLNSTDEADRTVRLDDWRMMQPLEGSAHGGPYLAVHLRRRDFSRAHPADVPSLPAAAGRIRRLAGDLGLRRVFLATDDPAAEAELAALLAQQQQQQQQLSLVRYRPAPAGSSSPPLTDGELAALDQLVCAHARHFVGTRSSTFTYRVAEERSLVGFARASSVDVWCGDGEGDGDSCQPGTYWPPMYEAEFTTVKAAGSSARLEEL